MIVATSAYIIHGIAIFQEIRQVNNTSCFCPITHMLSHQTIVDPQIVISKYTTT